MSSEIKSVISHLCKLLNMMFNANLKAEYFRLAKFDKTEENLIPILWTTLSLLTTKETKTEIGEIKNIMKSIKYSSISFYTLPEDFSSGSRELLLAIAFILAKNLPNLIKEQIKGSPFDESYSLIDLESTEIHKPDIQNLTDEQDIKNCIMWLKGRIRQNERLTQEYETHISKIYEKLNSQLNNKATGKLSLNEVLALTSKKYAKEFLEKSSHVSDLLECYREWVKKEKIFWRWMASVLYEREKE